MALYRKYQALAESTPNVHFLGRLGIYKYSTWISVAQALTLYTRIIGAHRADITLRTA